MEEDPSIDHLMKFLSAGALPAEPSIEKDILSTKTDEGSDGSDYLELGEAIEMLLEFYAKSSRAKFTKAQQEGEVSDIKMEEFLLSVLGTGFSLSYKPERTKDTPDRDISALVFVQSDFPSMQAGELKFKLGNPISRVPELLSAADLIGLDRHRPYCNIYLELQTEFTNFFGEEDFPFLLRDVKYVFSGPEKSLEYFRRGWRNLSENYVPLTDGDADPVIMSALYRWKVHEEIKVEKSFGNSMRIYRTRKDAKVTLNEHGVEPFDQIIVVILVENMITKLYMASRSQDIDMKEVNTLAEKAASRMRSFCAAVDCQSVIHQLPPPLLAFHGDLLNSWQKWIDRSVQRWQQVVQVTHDREACCVCAKEWVNNKRCAGCRQCVYCGRDCQRNHWKSGHKLECSLEYVTMETGKETT